MDFGYSLGVLHHIPDTQLGIIECVKKLKPGAPFLLYLYYAFDNKPRWFKLIFKISNLLRIGISKLPHPLRYLISQILALFVYFPLARFSLVMEKLGINVVNLPLSAYRYCSFYTMRTDALDRFGTSLEQRFSKKEITVMLGNAGFDLSTLKFSEVEPFWTFSIQKNSN